MIPKGVLSKVGDYYFTEKSYSDEIFRAVEEFFDAPNLRRDRQLNAGDGEDELFNEWFLYEFKFSDGKTALEKFYGENPLSIPEYRRKLYRELQENYYGVYEVLEVKPMKGLTLKHLGTEREFTVYEMSASMELEVGDTLIGRVGKVDDHYEIVGCNMPALKSGAEKNRERRIAQVKEVFPKLDGLSVKDMKTFRRFGR